MKHCEADDFPIPSTIKVKPMVSPTRNPNKRFMRGSNDNASTKVAVVPRRITAFIGRLHIDASENDIISLMSAAGMKDPKCQKMIPKENMKFKTSAFMVSCSILSEHLFYDKANWPAGCELRDWFFKDNKNHKKKAQDDLK